MPPADRGQKNLSLFFFRDRRRLGREVIELHADIGRFGRVGGQCDRPVEGGARLACPAELLQKAAAQAVIIEIAGKPLPKGSTIASAASGPSRFETATARLSVTTGEGCRRSSAW